MKKIVKVAIIFGIISILAIAMINFYNSDEQETISYDITKVTETMEIKDDDDVTE